MKGYRLYDLTTKKVLYSKDVVFQEVVEATTGVGASALPLPDPSRFADDYCVASPASCNPERPAPMPVDSSQPCDIGGGGRDTPDITAVEDAVGVLPPAAGAECDIEGGVRETLDVIEEEEEDSRVIEPQPVLRRSTRLRKPSQKLVESINGCVSEEVCFADVGEPRSLTEAFAGPKAKEWREAVDGDTPYGCPNRFFEWRSERRDLHGATQRLCGART